MFSTARVLIGAAVLLVGTAQVAQAQTPATRSERPNVLLIITDDVGYGDFGPYGVTDIRTRLFHVEIAPHET